jgi:integrase
VVADEFINLLPPGKTVPSQITKSDVMAYDDAMAARGLAKSTRSGRYTTLRCLLRHMNIDPNKLVGKAANQELKSKPKTEPEVYTNEEIEKLFAVATPYHALAWECFLKFGFRDEELAFLTWQDINFDAKTVSVTYKPGFKPKDHEERTVPCPETLLDKLKAWHDAHPSTRYVLGTSSDKPNIKFLKALKSDWRRAGMNCGRCEGCTRLVTYVTPAGKTHTRAQQECEHAYLHKFRSSYLTRMLSHTNSRNVQRLAGHSSLTTTERYLRAAATEQMQSAVNAAFA